MDVSVNKVNWKYWSRMRAVTLAEATLLLAGVEPQDHHNSLVELKKNRTATKAYRLLASAVDQEGGIKSVKSARDDIPAGMPCVDLPVFGAWARKSGFLLAEEFPVTHVLPSVRHHGGVEVEIPYPCQFVQELALIMWDHYGKIDPKNPPKSYCVEDDIVKRLPRVNARIAASLASWCAQGAPMEKLKSKRVSPSEQSRTKK